MADIWSVSQVSCWLKFSGFSKFEKLFSEHEIDGSVLLLLDHAWLKKMGICEIHDRISLVAAIQRLRTTPSPSLSPTSTRKVSCKTSGNEMKIKRSITGSNCTFVTDTSSDNARSSSNSFSFSALNILGNIVFKRKKSLNKKLGQAIDIMEYEHVLLRCIRIKDEEENFSHIINVSEFHTSQEILEKIFDRFQIPTDKRSRFGIFAEWDSFEEPLHNNPKLLLNVCKSIPPHPAKDKLTVRLLRSEDLVRKPSQMSTTPTSVRFVPLKERPSSDVISLNMDLFFSDFRERKHTNASTSSNLHEITPPTDNPCVLKVKDLEKTDLEAASAKIESDVCSEATFDEEADSSLARLGEYSTKFDYDLYERLYDLLHLNEPCDAGCKNWIKGDLIGKGSFASVFYGVDQDSGKIMAVKQVDLPSLSSMLNGRRAKMLMNLTKEIEFLKQFSHENIVGYLGSICDGLTLNVFLEYVGGGSISSLLRKTGWISVEDTRDLTFQIVSGLKYLHGLGVIHRDIKGENILVTEDKKCKISDFGVATLMSEVGSNRRSFAGSVFWMAPEVITQSSCTCKADMWSLGCLVLQMLTGERPWSGYDQIQALYQIGVGRKNPLEHLNEVWQSTSGKDLMEVFPSTILQFLTSCFHLEAENRLSSSELLEHKFLTLKYP